MTASLLELQHENFSVETKTVAFVGKYPLQTNTILDKKSTGQVSHLRFFGYDITYDVDLYVDNKLVKFQSICGTIRRIYRGKQGSNSTKVL